MRIRNPAQEPVIVLGSPRSGTSWTMRLIAKQAGYCSIFEPLHARWWPGAREAGFGNRPTTGDAQKREYLQRVFDGREARRSIRRPRWSLPIGSHPGRLLRGMVKRLRAERLVVKFVSACRLLPWLVEEFPKCRYVYIVRNPYAVINSQLSRGASSYLDDRARPYDYLNDARQPASAQTELCRRIQSDAADVLGEASVRDINSLEECLALSWYTDNWVAQRVASRTEAVILVKYEDLLVNTGAEVDRIYAHIGSGSPSSVSIEVKNRGQQLNKWREQLTDSQVRSIRAVLRALQNTHGSLSW